MPNPAIFSNPLIHQADDDTVFDHNARVESSSSPSSDTYPAVLNVNSKLIRIRLKEPEKYFKSDDNKKLAENLVYNTPEYGPYGQNLKFTIHTPELYSVQKSRPLWGQLIVSVNFKDEDDLWCYPKDGNTPHKVSWDDWDGTCAYDKPSTVKHNGTLRAYFIPKPYQWDKDDPNTKPEWIAGGRNVQFFTKLNTNVPAPGPVKLHPV